MKKKKSNQVLIFPFPKFSCAVVTANLFLRLKMFDPYNDLSKEQDWVLTEQLMMTQQPVNSVYKERERESNANLEYAFQISLDDFFLPV